MCKSAPAYSFDIAQILRLSARLIELYKNLGLAIIKHFILLQCGDTSHTLVELNDYKGAFLPNYHPHPDATPNNTAVKVRKG